MDIGGRPGEGQVQEDKGAVADAQGQQGDAFEHGGLGPEAPPGVAVLRKFFSCRHNFAPKGPDLGAKTGGKRLVAPKNRGIFVTCNLENFICPKFSTVLDFSARGPDREPFSILKDKKLKLSRPIKKGFRKSFNTNSHANVHCCSRRLYRHQHRRDACATD